MKVVSLNPGISLYLETFESNTTSDWLNQTIKPIRKCVRSTFKITKLFDKEAKNVLENGWLIGPSNLSLPPQCIPSFSEQLKTVVCKVFQFERTKTLSLETGLKRPVAWHLICRFIRGYIFVSIFLPTFNDHEKKPIENIVEKGENAGN